MDWSLVSSDHLADSFVGEFGQVVFLCCISPCDPQEGPRGFLNGRPHYISRDGVGEEFNINLAFRSLSWLKLFWFGIVSFDDSVSCN